MVCACRGGGWGCQSSLVSSTLSKRRSEPWSSTQISLPLRLNPKRVCLHAKTFDFPLLLAYGGNNNDGGGWNNNNNSNDSWWWHDDSNEPSGSLYPLLLFMSSFLCCFCHMHVAKALAIPQDDTVWEVKGSKWSRLIPDFSKDTFVAATATSLSSLLSVDNLCKQCRDMLMRLMLPQGFPNSVSSDYLDYSLWRGVQGIASQVSGVLATQALLYAVGLGKGAIPTAAAINWVLKDGIGYLSKIMLSKYGRHFDVNPKGWRLFADVLENAAFGLEMLTPAFPHLFVFIGAAAGAGRSAAALIQAATRSCFYAGFAAQRNFAEVIAKGEAQGMVSKSIGIMLGIALANCVGSSTPLALASFSVVTWIHMFCNLKSYQSIELRTLNPYRASLVFSEYLLTGQAPPVKEVNDEEPLFPALHILNIKFANKSQSVVLSIEAKNAAAEIERRLQLGSKLSDVIHNKEDALALFSLYKNEGYILTEHGGKFCFTCLAVDPHYALRLGFLDGSLPSKLRKLRYFILRKVVLKESSLPQDMLKSLFQVNYLYWLERNAGIVARSAAVDCRPGGKLHVSLEYVQREFDHVKNDSASVGWVTDGLIARPLSNRIRPGSVDSTAS